MTTTYSTANFTNFFAAVRYYKDYMPSASKPDLWHEVQCKIGRGEIAIGKPSLGGAIACTVNDEGRYILHYA